jgi:hypothetical protein
MPKQRSHCKHTAVKFLRLYPLINKRYTKGAANINTLHIAKTNQVSLNSFSAIKEDKAIPSKSWWKANAMSNVVKP